MTLFKHDDLKSYLRAYIQSLPAKGRGEGSRLARALGVSTTLISQVLAGDKSLTQEQAQRLAQYLGLSDIENDYMMFLLQVERAGSPDLKRYWRSKVEELRNRSLKLSHRLQPKRVLTEGERVRFYSSPLYSMVRLFTSVGDEGKSVVAISERFGLTRAKAVEILSFLVETGLCVEKNDRYSLGPQSIHVEQGSPHLLRHQTNWRLRALSQSEKIGEDELMFTSVVSLSKKDFNILREETVGFIKDFLKRVHASPAEEIACMNIDFFWIR